MDFLPKSRGGCHFLLKWTPSTSMSVETSHVPDAGPPKTEQSSPIPLISPVTDDPEVIFRMCSIMLRSERIISVSPEKKRRIHPCEKPPYFTRFKPAPCVILPLHGVLARPKSTALTNRSSPPMVKISNPVI